MPILCMTCQKQDILNATNVEAVTRAPLTGSNSSIQIIIVTVQKLQGALNTLKKVQSMNTNRVNSTGNTTTKTNDEPCWYLNKLKQLPSTLFGDRNTKIRLLANSGSVVSVIPRSAVQYKSSLNALHLYATNQSTINTFGKHVRSST